MFESHEVLDQSRFSSSANKLEDFRGELMNPDTGILVKMGKDVESINKQRWIMYGGLLVITGLLLPIFFAVLSSGDVSIALH